LDKTNWTTQIGQHKLDNTNWTTQIGNTQIGQHKLDNTNPFYCYVFIKREYSELFIDSPSFYLFKLYALSGRHFMNIAALYLKIL